MAKFWLSIGVLLSLGGCVAGEYGYTTSASNYAPDYPVNYPSGYYYGDPEPAYSPPFWESGLQLEFGGGRRHHHRHGEGDWDRGD